VLGKAEYNQEDPEQLDLLFQLDHLATRARPNAENLVILGGEQPRRQWRNPVALSEIVRAAVAETEEYRRVRITRMPDEFVSGAVVADLIHLLAELLDNATSYSPPDSRVELSGNRAGRGVTVEIIDQGLGVLEAELIQINAALREPPSFSAMQLSSDSRLGLFVVGQLAARHGISVRLAESEYRGIPLVDGAGAEIPGAAGSSREHYALCRCGHSQNKPFCSGMHWYVDFHDPVPDPEATPSIFEWVGEYPGLERLTRLFYEKYLPADPLLAPPFATMSADHPQRVATWLGEVLGGPANYSSEYGGYPRMLSQHVGKGITEQQRARWVELLLRSAAEAGLPDDAEFRSVFASDLEWESRLAAGNSQTDAQAPPHLPPPHLPTPHLPTPHWDWTLAAGLPGSRIAATASQDDEPPVVLPASDETIGSTRTSKRCFALGTGNR